MRESRVRGNILVLERESVRTVVFFDTHFAGHGCCPIPHAVSL